MFFSQLIALFRQLVAQRMGKFPEQFFHRIYLHSSLILHCSIDLGNILRYELAIFYLREIFFFSLGCPHMVEFYMNNRN